MKRRELITLLGGATVVWPLAARAADRQAADHRHLGHCYAFDPESVVHRVVQRLRELGWIEDRAVAIETPLGGGTQRALHGRLHRLK